MLCLSPLRVDLRRAKMIATTTLVQFATQPLLSQLWEWVAPEVARQIRLSAGSMQLRAIRARLNSSKTTGWRRYSASSYKMMKMQNFYEPNRLPVL